MQQSETKKASRLMIIIAFAIVYIVWGSTYFFIQRALENGFPALLLGAFRFIVAGTIMIVWCLFRGEKIFDVQSMKTAAVGGLLMLFVGNGIVIWVEQSLPSAMAAIMVSSTPLWFIVLDKPKWKINLNNRRTVGGLALGFAGVILLFGERIKHAFSSMGSSTEIVGLTLLMIGVMAWAGGSLYTKYNSHGGSAIVSTAWQMFFAGLAFIPLMLLRNEELHFHWSDVTVKGWLSVGFLVTMGSIAAFSAYVWLLQVCSATQVSTYAYVNPVVAVLLGVLFAGEKISGFQVAGLGIILFSVLLINIANYTKKKASIAESEERSATRQQAKIKI
ncbi:MAG: EamA family transporter [Flavitalea sp.]